MAERFSRKGITSLDNFQCTFGPDAVLGVEIKCTASGKNKFILKLEKSLSPLKICYLLVNRYLMISIPEFSKLTADAYPDFIFKPTKFMSFTQFAKILNVSHEIIAVNVMKNIKKMFTKHLSYRSNDGVNICISDYSYGYDVGDYSIVEHTPKFKSFSEFLVWTDLNIV